MRVRAILGLVLLLTAALASLVWTGRQSDLWRPQLWEAADPDDEIDRHRFESVKPFLPRSGAVAYREDPGPAETDGVVFRFTQYVLAPVELSQQAEGPYILVNGRPEREPVIESGGRSLVLVHDAGNGVRLYRVAER